MKYKLKLPIGLLISTSLVLTVISQLPLVFYLALRGTPVSEWFSLSDRFAISWSGGGCDNELAGLCTEPFSNVSRVISLTDVFVWYILCLLISFIIIDFITTIRINNNISKKSIYAVVGKLYYEKNIILPVTIAAVLSLLYSVINILFTAVPLIMSKLRSNSDLLQWVSEIIYKEECYPSYRDSYTSCALQTVSILDTALWFVVWFVLFAIGIVVILAVSSKPDADKNIVM